MNNLQNEIGSLPPAEKFDLLDALALTAEQRAELDHRVARCQQNPADVASWEKVRADLRKGR